MATVAKIYVGGMDGKAAQIYPSKVDTRTMTARFNLSDSNPATWGEYLDDAVDMTAGSADWDKFFGHYPAMIKDGAIVGKLDPSQGFAKYVDGTAADITSGDEGDVMIVFPRRDLRIWSDNGYMYVSITGELGKENYDHYAHKYNGNDCDWFALGRYKGYYYDAGGVLRSLSNKYITTSETMTTFRDGAHANGPGYELSAFFQLTYRQAMYMLKYLGQNAQTAIGKGVTSASSKVTYTGGTDSHGMDYGTNDGTTQMSLFGLEDFYGNVNEWTDGIFAASNTRKLMASDGNYNNTGSGYIDITDKTSSSNYNKYMKTALMTNLGGFAPDVSSADTGSATTYFCDNPNVTAYRSAYFGGSYNMEDMAGVFTLYVYGQATVANSSVGARLMYLHTT